MVTGDEMFLQRSGILLLLAAQIVTGSEFVRKDIALDEGQLSFLLRPGETPALILIPGSFWDSSLWDEVIPHLDHEMSLVLVEMRGHGRSWPPAKDGSIELFATDVLRVADALGLNEFYVGGHSIGGMVALEVGDRRPESVLGVVSIEGWTNHHAAQDAFEGRMTDTLTPELRTKEKEGRERATGRWTTEQRKAFARIWRQWDGSHFLQSTNLPVLELYGDRGRPTPTLEQLRIPLRRNVRVAWINNASHNLPLEQPDKVGRAIKHFIDQWESHRVGGSGPPADGR